MSRPALFSYEGALRVLGKYDRPWLDATDTFLGVGILVGGAVDPDILELVDPKNEATACVRKILDGVTDKLTGLSGTPRHELIAAAHAIIAVSSVFESFGDEIGGDFDLLKITDREKFRIFNAEPPGKKKEISALPALTSIAVPAPSATRGFQENLDGELSQFFHQAVTAVLRFVRGLEDTAFLGRENHVRSLTARSRDKYTHHYIGLAAAIPEFRFWALLGEHSATRAAIEEKNAELARSLAAVRTESLELFAQLLAQLSSDRALPGQKYREKLRNVAKAVLGRPLIGTNIDSASIDAAFPTVEDGFVAPSYRLTVHDDATIASSEDWWGYRTEVRDDLDAFLAAHLAGAESTTCPLLVLGNPGAGKSLLMEVLAARLPADRFTVVTVQLRKVRAEDRLEDQIETALRPILGKGVDWEQLADACEDSLPVILLDGFDELIQASGVHQSNYLKQVQEFQKQQAILGQPVAVVVTSRMLVADRARIPLGVPIVKLEEFDNTRIERWLGAWNAANQNTHDFHPLSLEALVHHVELARQPLLLLILAIYAADPTQPPLSDPNLSNAELYRRIINLFVVRQVSQKSPEPLAPAIIRTHAVRGSWRLGITAFAMFNRGHQYVTATHLNKDLEIFAPGPEVRPSSTFDTAIDETDRTVENFIFIHSPTRNDGASPDQRTYEFLHATFGEYLIAEVTMKLLVQVATARELPTANPFEQAAAPDDSLLFALTSHQSFVKRKPIIEFSQGLFRALPEVDQKRVMRTLDDLIRSFPDRPLTDLYASYKPAPATVISRVANYSANLLCLRVLLSEDQPTPIEDLFRKDAEGPLAGWQTAVHLWMSGLDSEGWAAVLDAITLNRSKWWQLVPQTDIFIMRREQEARLLGDPELEGMLRTGGFFVSYDVTGGASEQSLLENLSRWVVHLSGSGADNRAIPFHVRKLSRILDDLDSGTHLNRQARRILAMALSREAPRLPIEIVKRGLRHVIPRTHEEASTTRVSTFDLISMICSHPELAGRGVLPSALLPHLFRGNEGSALGSTVLTWGKQNSIDGPVDDSFRDFARQVQLAAAPYLDQADNTLLPIESFEYLAHPRTTEPSFNERLLVTLITIVEGAADEVRPRTFLALTERFRPHVKPTAIAAFAERYLDFRTVANSPEDQEALAELRLIAEQAD